MQPFSHLNEWYTLIKLVQILVGAANAMAFAFIQSPNSSTVAKTVNTLSLGISLFRSSERIITSFKGIPLLR